MSKKKEEKELTGRSLTGSGNITGLGGSPILGGITGPGDGPTDGKDKDKDDPYRKPYQPLPGTGTIGRYPEVEKP